MTSQQELIIEKIKSLDNRDLLKEIQFLIDFESKYPEKFEFTQDEINVLESRIRSVDSGESFTNDEANKKASEWLNSK
ncbi:MAG: hypothetical protein RIF33_24300 [Cyclobacteriaceae bacterium]